jgi:hypothetical protein
VRKEIQGSGKAPFPGEKMITDESPRMEDEESGDFDSSDEHFNLIKNDGSN